ncbi:piggyBac transposable element-derived protein 4-like [Silurus meridionalis]|uniref:piggyBac transposable element-derived protein 4-like n=1 Tax=Silurus meridionalis TaxID=175797 RepID=UPI001EECDA2D|nr:piggyBac transposable element-derived protein 4-like [Silurus meridionalis]XP_046726711.1 piggyBac transposable element-derived protein 4-like [Silurus meridionalis]XP_046726712.1 piggyBac transposable element-derived protein 4-like [Silurus meridionalis]
MKRASKKRRTITSEEVLEEDMQPDSSVLQESFSDSADSRDSDPDFVAASSSSTSTTESEGDSEDPGDSGSGWIGKNGQVWFPNNEETLRFVKHARGVTSGPTRYAIARVQDVDSAFDLFFTVEMIDLIVNMTNLNGQRTNKTWTDVDSTDVKAYMGLIILAGVYRSRGESTGSLWDDRSGRAVFKATMSLSRFHEISRALSFNDKLKKAARQRDDKLAPIRTLWEMWAPRLQMLYNPGRDVTVDEQLVAFKGRCRFRQYMPKKPAKYGLKLWIICDAVTSYAWRCSPYLGKTENAPEVGQGMRVVKELTEGLQGVTVTCDNFFTSYPLAQELLKKKISLVGTIRKNKPELPPNLLEVRGKPFPSSVFAFTNNTTAVNYIQKRGRNVILLSTRHREAVVTEGPKCKPEIVNYYNRCKGGVDNLDKVVGTYSCRRKTNRWPQTFFFNMVDLSAYNAYVIFTAIDPSWNCQKLYRRRLFLEELGHSMVSAAIVKRKHLPRTPIAAAMVRELQSSVAAAPQTPAGTSNVAIQRGTCKCCKNRTICTCMACGRFSCKNHYVICCKDCWPN